MIVATLDRTDDAVISFLTELHAQLDRLSPSISGDNARQALILTDRAIARLSSLKLAVVAAADRTDVSRQAGLPDTTSWLAIHTRTTGAKAAEQVHLARELDTLAVTQESLAGGEVSMAHAAVIASVQRQLPPELTPQQRQASEAKLVDLAKTLDPATLRRRGRSILEDITSRDEAERHHDQVVRDEEARARAKTRLTMHDNGDGTTSGHFTVPTIAGSLLRKIVQQMTAPRRASLGATVAHAGTIDENRDLPHRHGLAFVELLEHLPTDHLHRKVAATLVVTLEHRQLLDDLSAARVDTGGEISASQARRLACNASILPAVLGAHSVVLDLGRSQRLFNEPQQVALATLHQACVADGCERPFAWCELHHRDPWSHGGPTDLSNAEPLCSWHHQRIHDPAYGHRRQPDGSVRFHRRT